MSLKSTHITSIKGYDVRIPNKDILNNTLENYGKMKYRRVRFDLGVVYNTPVDKLKKIPQIIQNIIEKEDEVMFERCHLTELASYSINFKTSYVIKKKDYQIYLHINEHVLLEILEKFEKEAIELAFPTQVIHSKNETIYPENPKKTKEKKPKSL
ncbi:MAG: mechanosensitive ion channel family protein [bacterium]|nr:mechanosensitive ion channel family protein [bacterium]